MSEKSLTKEEVIRALDELKALGIRVTNKPGSLTLSVTAKTVAVRYGVSCAQLHSDVMRYRHEKYKTYMRNYMRKYRNSKVSDK